MLIGILQTGIAPDSLRLSQGDYPDMFERLLGHDGFTYRTWRVVENDLPAAPVEADGWLITGSRHGAYEDLPFIKPLEAFIRAVFDARVPMVGICFGHQIIAQALGGRVEKFAGGWNIGAQDYDFAGERVTMNAWHQDQVTALPPGATVVGRAPSCEIAALAYDDRILTVQAHPEFGDAAVEALMDTRAATVPPDRLAAARARLGTPLSSPAIGDRLADFLRRPRTDAAAAAPREEGRAAHVGLDG